MKTTITGTLIGLFCATVLASSALAAKDEYLGDSSIYAGVPTTSSRPNVLLIVDNSRATLNTAAGFSYIPEGMTTAPIYPPVPEPTKTCTAGVSSPANGCFLPWYIYAIDNQGDVANQHVLADTTSALSALTCTANDDVIRKTLLQRGTYSGSGTADYPNINGNTGGCDIAPQGKVYVLGNYLNYTRTANPPQVLPPSVPAACNDANLPANPVVKAFEWKNGSWTASKFAFFRLKNTPGSTHTPSTLGYDNSYTPYNAKAGPGNPQPDNPEIAYWEQLPSSPEPTSFVQWLPATTYSRSVDVTVPTGNDAEGNPINPDNKTCAQLIADASVTPPSTNVPLTQREVMYVALEQAVGGALGAVNFGAMVYGSNNSGGTKIFDMADLSQGTDHDEDPLTGELKPVAPDCSNSDYSTLPFCQFLAALPGKRTTDPLPNNYSCSDFNGAGCVSSATGRPQAESVFDAGYYFGANYQSITNTDRIPDAIKNVCGLNHIILLTNGFTNGDGSPKMAVVGDADGDQYPDEGVYGLGSHWLDDVAKYLNVNYGITFHAVVAFQEKDDLIEDAAVTDGGGKFYQAYNAQQLAEKLTKLFAGIINPKSTSFVAPVVPASTTNRTISSNKVYLGLFRPQQVGPWHGNVKKYSVSDASTNQLMGFAADGTTAAAATDAYGSFYRDSISYWSLIGGVVPSSKGDINPLGTDPNKARGDGGEVDAGGAGAGLLKRVEALAAAVQAGGWAQAVVPWRNIYTSVPGTDLSVETNRDLTTAANRFSTDNAALTPAILGVADAPKRDNLIRYLHGFANNDLGLSGTATARPWVLGDVLHSRPQVVSYNRYGEAQEGVCDSAAVGGYNGSIIYVGANDGMLHAFRDCDGKEIWAFVPPGALADLKYLKDPAAGGHPTFMDGAPSFFKYDVNGDGIINPLTDKVILVIGQRRGGGHEPGDPTKYRLDNVTRRGDYYALDVTNPYTPKLLWRGNSLELGETWSQPMMAKVLASDSASTRVVKEVFFIGGGYDNIEDLRYGDTQTFPDPTGRDINAAPSGGTVDGLSGGADSRQTSTGTLTTDDMTGTIPGPRGRGIYAVEIATFTLDKASGTSTVSVNTGTPTAYWSYTHAQNGDMNFSFASDLTALDMNGDGFTDRIYTGDTGGNLWRFDLSSMDKNNWTGEILFKANPGSDGSNGRKIFYPPAVAIYNGAPHIYIGTGDREHPLNRSVTDRMYCVIDWKDTGATVTYPLDETYLEDVTVNLLQDTASGSAANDATLTADLKRRLYSTPSKPYDDQGHYTSGWYIKLDGTDFSMTADPGEKILAQAEVFSGAVYFNTYKLTVGTRAGCDAGNLGESFGYAVDFKTGEAVFNFYAANDVSVDLNNAEAVQTFVQTTNERAVGDVPGEILKRQDRRRALGSGIPSGAVIVVDSAGRVKLLMSSSEKVSVFEGYSTKAVHPIYWMQW